MSATAAAVATPGDEAAGRPRLPPGSDLPALLQTIAVVSNPAAFITNARDRYGDVFTLRIVGAPPFVIVSDPAAIRDVFTGPADVMLAGEANAPLAPLVGPRSVLTLDRDEHLRERRRLLPAFHGERLAVYERIIERAALREIEAWPTGRPFALIDSMQEVTLEVIMRAVLGVSAGTRYEELAARIRKALQPVGGRVGQMLNLLGIDTALQRTFEQRVAEVDELIFAELADRRADPDLERREDVLSMLVLAGLTDDELRDEVVTLLVAGHETTAVALAWTFERLLRHPDVLARLPHEERLLDATVREALRVRPVIPSVGRLLARDHRVGGFLLPAGTLVVPSVVLTHAREDAYPDHERFDPDRFLDPATTPGTYTFLPFGGGPRRCLGASFALMEMRVVVRTVLEHATLEAVDPDEDERVARRNVTLAPGRGARVVRRA